MLEAELHDRVHDAVARLDGRASVYLRHFGTGREIAIDADDVYPAACIVKVPILLALLERVEAGDIDWGAPLLVTDDRAYGLNQTIDRLRPGSSVDLEELIFFMIAPSDVAAGLWCQDLAGGGAAVNAWLERRGYERTRINSRTPGREQDFAEWGWGQTTPRECIGLLASIRERRAVSPAADAYADRLLGSSIFVQDSMAALPTDVHVITKTGAVDRSRSEALLISSPTGAIGCCVMTDCLADATWSLDNAGQRLLRDITGLVWLAWGSGSHTSHPVPWPPGSSSW